MNRTRGAVGVVGLVLACAGLAAVAHASRPAAAAAAPAATGCAHPPAVYPEAAIKAGLVGTGKTVLHGTKPTAFGVKVVGVLTDGIAPGLDMIIVKLSGPVVTQAGGAFEGISGSPVYVGGKLLGSVSYSLSGDFTVAGLTPAQPMMQLFGLPRGGATAARATAPKMANHARLTPALRRAVGAVSHTSAASSGSMSLLKIPIGVSGLTDIGLQRLQKVFDRYGLAYRAVRGSAAAAPAGVSGPPIVAGGNFTATQSFGDLTFYGLGTATAVCGDEVVAFGHPFFFTGPTALGMNNANTIMILKDPFFPFKLANITGFRGIVDQDRLAGIRGITGGRPQLTDLTSAIANADLGTSRNGRTEIADQTLMALIAQNALYVENVVSFDREGSGSETMRWKVTGSFHGDPFTLTRTGVIYSSSDINFDSSLELVGELGALTGSKFGAATITGVHFAGTVTQAQKTARIGQVESASSLQPNFAVRRTLRVRPGDTVRLRVTLARADGTTGVTAMSLGLPAAFHGGALRVRGGVPPEGCPFCAFGETFKTTAKSFAQLVAEFQNGEHANDLIAGVGKAKTTVPKANQILGSKAISLVVG